MIGFSVFLSCPSIWRIVSRALARICWGVCPRRLSLRGFIGEYKSSGEMEVVSDVIVDSDTPKTSLRTPVLFSMTCNVPFWSNWSCILTNRTCVLYEGYPAANLNISKRQSLHSVSRIILDTKDAKLPLDGVECDFQNSSCNPTGHRNSTCKQCNIRRACV